MVFILRDISAEIISHFSHKVYPLNTTTFCFKCTFHKYTEDVFIINHVIFKNLTSRIAGISFQKKQGNLPKQLNQAKCGFYSL
jgi:hypothetical protein